MKSANINYNIRQTGKVSPLSFTYKCAYSDQLGNIIRHI